MASKLVSFLLWLESKVRGWRERFDKCHICGEPAERWCVSCGKRHCDEHESYFYGDTELCDSCESEITPEQREEMHQEYIASNCESGCHKPDCPCTRSHTKHTEACAVCECQDSGSCDGACKPSGFHWEEVAASK